MDPWCVCVCVLRHGNSHSAIYLDKYCTALILCIITDARPTFTRRCTEPSMKIWQMYRAIYGNMEVKVKVIVFLWMPRRYMGTSSLILNFSTRLASVISFMTWVCCCQCPLKRRLSGSQSLSGYFGKELQALGPARTWTTIPQSSSPVQSPVIIQITLSWLHENIHTIQHLQYDTFYLISLTLEI
jgi:hypothetical protein